jgi:hypothetical protein
MRTTLIGSAIALVLVKGTALAQQIEYNSDRFGSDIPGADIQLSEHGKPTDCASACTALGKCRAWAFLHPYYFSGNKNTYCKLKYEVPPKTDSSRTDSGVKECYGCNLQPPDAGHPAAPAPQGGGSEAQQIVQAHNKYRAEVGVPPIQWSSDLANHAQEWANYLTNNLLFQHSGAAGEGENLWAGTSGAFSFTQMIDTFGNEKRNFTYGAFPNVSSTGSWFDVGHYTQLVWRNTTYVGCAGADGRDGTYRLVCRYSPPGNYTGQAAY